MRYFAAALCNHTQIISLLQGNNVMEYERYSFVTTNQNTITDAITDAITLLKVERREQQLTINI